MKDNVNMLPAESLKQTELKTKTYRDIANKGFLMLLFVISLGSILTFVERASFDNSVCSYEVTGQADLSRLNFLPPEGNLTGNVGQAGVIVKGQTFCRDVEDLLSSEIRN